MDASASFRSATSSSSPRTSAAASLRTRPRSSFSVSSLVSAVAPELDAGGGVLSDYWLSEQQGRAMGIDALMSILGPNRRASCPTGDLCTKVPLTES